MSNKKEGKVICVVGNIGAGKSHFCKKIRELFPSVPVFNDELEGQREVTQLYYEEPETYTPLMQAMKLLGKSLNLLDANTEGGVTVVERTIEDNCQIFALHRHEQGYSSKKAWCQYMRLYLHFINTIKQPSIYIYLKATAPFLFHRIRYIRKRPGEEHITTAYLQEINRRYNAWVEELKERGENVCVVQVDHDFSDKEIQDIFKTAYMALADSKNSKCNCYQCEYMRHEEPIYLQD